MKLSLPQSRSSGSLLLLLVSILSLWETSASAYFCNEPCQLALLFDYASTLSHNINNVSSDTLDAFHEKYASAENFQNKVPMSCNTASFTVPKTMNDIYRMESEELLKRTVSILRSWKQHLRYLLDEMSDMEEAPVSILTKIRYIDENIRSLLENMTFILGKVYPGAEKNGKYPVSSGQSSFQEANDDYRIFTFYSLLRCLHTDSNKVTFYITLLRCRLVPTANC